MKYVNIQDRRFLTGIADFFLDWKKENESIVILSPHDDDALLGAGYMIYEGLKHHAKVNIIIFHSGNAGYSNPSLKKEIVEIRKKETIQAYKAIGVSENHIMRLDLPDFSGMNYLGWYGPTSEKKDNKIGKFEEILTLLRRLKTTRLLFANDYREHMDHSAVAYTGMFYGPQVGDPVVVDWAKPSKIKSYMQYSVWSKFENLADRVLIANDEEEMTIRKGIMKWKSQLDIIGGILQVREERKTETDGYIEVYKTVDPRPKMNYQTYKSILNEI
ncbi:MAG: hypothetical protein GF364_21930 [Candidatus Lokiarchaeota archaeon]|nr:hypothetical protein [Candidatus Lokiarchaeota archaeon]